MNIQAISAYNQNNIGITKDINELKSLTGLSKENNTISKNALGDATLNSGDTANLITQNEREFFIQMFPQNQTQLEKHEVFTRNGKLQSTTFSKGMIIDGRV